MRPPRTPGWMPQHVLSDHVQRRKQKKSPEDDTSTRSFLSCAKTNVDRAPALRQLDNIIIAVIIAGIIGVPFHSSPDRIMILWIHTRK